MKKTLLALFSLSLVAIGYGANISTTTGIDADTPWIDLLRRLDAGTASLKVTSLGGLGTGVGTFLATPSSANLLAAVTDETGTGALVFANGPTLIAPVLGTPVSGVATNLTGTATGLTAGTISAGATVTGLVFAAGTTTVAPQTMTSGTNLTSAVAGATEYDGVQYYRTLDTSSGRGAVPVEQYFHLTATGGAITTIANFFGATSNPNLVANGYYIIDFDMWFLSSSTGTVVWTLTNSAAPTSQNIIFDMSPVTGVVAPPGTATQLHGEIYNDNTAAKALTATGALSAGANYHTHIQVQLQNGTGTNLKIQATVSAGNITPGINSSWRCRRISPNNVGTFAP